MTYRSAFAGHSPDDASIRVHPVDRSGNLCLDSRHGEASIVTRARLKKPGRYRALLMVGQGKSERVLHELKFIAKFPNADRPKREESGKAMAVVQKAPYLRSFIDAVGARLGNQAVKRAKR